LSRTREKKKGGEKPVHNRAVRNAPMPSKFDNEGKERKIGLRGPKCQVGRGGGGGE